METNTTPIPTIPSIEAGLTLLASNLVPATRTDGTEYRMLREDCPMHDDLADVVRAAHNGELPNDWRYGMVHTLAHALLEYSEPSPTPWTLEDFQDVVGEVAELHTDHAYSRALGWLADNVSRCHFDDVEAYASDCSGDDLGQLAIRRQLEEVHTMAHTIITGLDALVSA
jgi:hypothetical protein